MAVLNFVIRIVLLFFYIFRGPFIWVRGDKLKVKYDVKLKSYRSKPTKSQF
ncbi:hypothetical protein MWMV2_MWMV2_03663 [Acinetobacter oleivorans]|nr:hypothetical protein MWMV5_MWMV5_03664 [Acinetobacter oleivorans]CAI3119667.1 hypothetical protein MWMV13_MWMV13_03665 [Acinetobacter oleivorans]CAI3119759.1 hypothetical protein MWMV2_MWMV2_03663 [Acinetobacter oleivorans]CAI3119995.1 hypothetical protein MWMV12_MWMV12_03683 [Acinetobacter oleivorans]CAI3120005.1 hypothetical protein MWMV3_MWMV3_03721 [Acinetobacter oleivorans]